jgi:hypothetical protein
LETDAIDVATVGLQFPDQLVSDVLDLRPAGVGQFVDAPDGELNWGGGSRSSPEVLLVDGYGGHEALGSFVWINGIVSNHVSDPSTSSPFLSSGNF